VNILLAEDNPVNQLVTQAMLVQLGHSVRLVADGQQCLQALTQDAFDLLLLDVQMPHKDGTATLKDLRRQPLAHNRRLPVIMLTGHASSDNAPGWRARGADACLCKPVNRSALEKAIAQVMLERLDPLA
jgi:CheY-like chemotaxis protein